MGKMTYIRPVCFRLLSVLLFLPFLSLPLAGQSPAFTLEQCIDSVVVHSYLYQADQYRTQAAEREADISHTYLLPSLTGDAGVEGRFLRPYNFGRPGPLCMATGRWGIFLRKPTGWHVSRW
jgi:hypothetical protein